MIRGARSKAEELLDQIFSEIAPDAPPMLPEQRSAEGYYQRAQWVAEHLRGKEFTAGHYESEEESAAAFDRAVPTDLFTVYREVCGALIGPRPAQLDRKSKLEMRVDRVLVPKPELLRLGWKFGIVGCELKDSGIKIGPALAQVLDYSHTVWTLQPSRFRIVLDYVFIWPMAKQGGTVASICAQHRIGSAYGDERFIRFGLKSGECPPLLEVGQDGTIKVGTVQAGARAGSR